MKMECEQEDDSSSYQSSSSSEMEMEMETKNIIVTAYQQRKDRLWRPWEDIENRVPMPNNLVLQVNHRCPISTCKEHSGFKRKPELTRHLNTQHTNTREECEHCQKVFTRKDNLTRHMKSAHDDKSKPECKFCRKGLSRRDAVNRHEVSCPKNPMRPKGINLQLSKAKQSKSKKSA